jgi:hypothetical protein
MATQAADNLVRWSCGDALEAFRWVDPGTTIALGPRYAVGCTGQRPGQAPLAMGGRWLAPLKRALCSWVVAAIRWQAHGWMDYRWVRGPAPKPTAALQNIAVG